MWPGMRPAHGVDGKHHVHAAGGQGGGELRHGVLALGHGQPVAGNDHHALGIAELDGNVFRRGRAHRPVAHGGGARRRAALERAEHDSGDARGPWRRP